MAVKRLLVVLLLVAMLAHTCGAVASAIPFFCSLNEIQCPSNINQCIQSLELCNGIKNCADGSDENAEFCKAYACDDTHPLSPIDVVKNQYFWQRVVKYNRKCPSGNMCTKTAVAGYSHSGGHLGEYFGDAWLCTGGKEDCADGSDEDPRYCKTLAQNCSLNAQGVYDHNFSVVADTCPSKKYCVAKDKLCDGKKECVDGSDEWPSFCETYTCPNERDLPEDFVPAPFRCKDWGCLSNEYDQLCDGVKDCGDGSDEDPEFCAKYSCPRSEGKKCSDGRTCLADSQLCDGIQTCPDGSDESPSFCRTFKCPGRKYKCKDGMQCGGYVGKDERCSHRARNGDYPYCKDKSDANNALCPPGPGPTQHDVLNIGVNEVITCPSGVGKVRQGLLCDGIPDCADGSDEGESCRTYDCFFSALLHFRSVLCKDTMKCTLGSPCNGWIDCKDKSDEDPAFCETFSCHPGHQKCKDFPYQCIRDEFVCDGTKHCINGGDEDEALCKDRGCPPFSQRCLNEPYRCVSDFELCDGEKQCVNGGDEDSAFCKSFNCASGMQKCPNDPYRCIHENYLCDGNKECMNGGDEDPKFCETFNCTEGLNLPKQKCPNYPYLCIEQQSLCDGQKECPNGGDEDPAFCKNFKCLGGTIKCPNSPTYECVNELSLCDGHEHCSDGSDEDPEFCKAFKCSDNHWKCSDFSRCIPNSFWCNGNNDCPDGSDEDPIICEDISKEQSYIFPTFSSHDSKMEL